MVKPKRRARSRYVRTLLIVVITLGVILVGGVAVVVGTIIKRVSDLKAMFRFARFW